MAHFQSSKNLCLQRALVEGPNEVTPTLEISATEHILNVYKTSAHQNQDLKTKTTSGLQCKIVFKDQPQNSSTSSQSLYDLPQA